MIYMNSFPLNQKGYKTFNLWAGYSLENPKSSMDENETFIFPDVLEQKAKGGNQADYVARELNISLQTAQEYLQTFGKQIEKN